MLQTAITELKLNPQSENDKMLGQMKDLGYNSHDSVFNIGTLGVVSAIYYIRVAFYYFGVKWYVPTY